MTTSGEVKLPYRTALNGENCADGEIVLNEDDCKAASDKLGTEYVGRTTSRGRPAGCYWARRSISNMDYAFSYFNTIVNVSSAKPIKGRKHGGICSVSNNEPYTGVFAFYHDPKPFQ